MEGFYEYISPLLGIIYMTPSHSQHECVLNITFPRYLLCRVSPNKMLMSQSHRFMPLIKMMTLKVLQFLGINNMNVKADCDVNIHLGSVQMIFDSESSP